MRAIDPNEPIENFEDRAVLIKDGVFIFALIVIGAVMFAIIGNEDHPAEQEPASIDTLYVKSEPGKRTIIIVHD